MSLPESADLRGVHPQPAYRWFRAGTLPVPARKMGKLILVGELDISVPRTAALAVYARVSSAESGTISTARSLG